MHHFNKARFRFRDRVETIIYQINKWMKVVFEKLGINESNSTLLTRYSIANHLKQLSVSTEVIKIC